MAMPALSDVDSLAWLEERLERAARDGGVPALVWREALYGPLRDFLSRPSKGIRAALVSTSFAAAGGSGDAPSALVAMIELLHAGSLIIDDIEDGAETRRGAPALHVRHGLPTALNTGNWLYFHALSLIDDLSVSAEVALDLYRRANTTLVRCHDGQALDLSARVGALSQRHVPNVVRHTTELKTGALMSLSAYAGARVAGADAERANRLAVFGRELGTALQMLDDLGSVRSPARRDKGIEDLRGGRPTWPWAWLAESSSEDTFDELQRAARDVERDGSGADELLVRLREALGDRPRATVHELLLRAQRDLARDIGQTDALRQLSRDVARLEQSYG